MVSLSMTLSDPWPGFQDHGSFKNEYLENCAFLQGVSIAASPVLATIGMSVCLSVCLSVTHWHWQRKLGSRNLHRRIAQRTSFRDKKFIQKFERVHPKRGRQMRMGLGKYRKSHTPFRLVPKSTTLDDLEWSICTLLQKWRVFRSPPQKFEWR